VKKTICSSLPRRRESRKARKDWIPAFAGMTVKTAITSFSATFLKHPFRDKGTEGDSKQRYPMIFKKRSKDYEKGGSDH
jgi:hypothetical protein